MTNPCRHADYICIYTDLQYKVFQCIADIKVNTHCLSHVLMCQTLPYIAKQCLEAVQFHYLLILFAFNFANILYC